MSLIAGTWHVVSVRRMPAGRRIGALNVHQTRTVELKLPYDHTFDLCLEAVLMRGGSIHLKNRAQGTILAKTSMNMKSWGNAVSFEINRVGANRTNVNISSKPSQRTTLVDYGSNLENVETIVAFLKLKEERES